MRLGNVTVLALLILAVLGAVPGVASSRQGAGGNPTTQVVDLYSARPIEGALETLRQRYHLPITYEDPVYACPCDLVDLTYTRKTPGPRIIGPKLGRIHFEYAEVDGKPQEDITSLIRRLLTEFAAQGGPVFDVRERTMPKGTEWNVVPLKARGSSGGFVNQPDILGARIFIPKARRTVGEFLVEMRQQLRTETGYRVDLGTVETRIDVGTAELGAENVPARDVLASLFSTDMFWDLNYDPEGEGRYVLNLAWTPRTPWAPPTVHLAVPSATQPHGPGHLPPGAVGHLMTTRRGRLELQSKLAQAGYYTGEPSGELDAKTVDALKKFQAANNIPVTGGLDPETIRKLGLEIIPPAAAVTPGDARTERVCVKARKSVTQCSMSGVARHMRIRNWALAMKFRLNCSRNP